VFDSNKCGPLALMLVLTSCTTREQLEIEQEQVEITKLREACEHKYIVLERGKATPRPGSITVETTVTPAECGRVGIVVRERQ
jgi:hypothetical protein